MEVSESEFNSDVPTNVITELKYDEHIEPSVAIIVVLPDNFTRGKGGS